MHFTVSHVEGPMDFSLRRMNPFHQLMSLCMIYSKSNYSLYYHPIMDVVEMCQNIERKTLEKFNFSEKG